MSEFETQRNAVDKLPKLEWTEALSTGDPSMDVQHRYLISVINSLGDALEAGKAKTKIKTIIHLLLNYAGWHFEREEECMDRAKCPAATANKEAHAAFRIAFKKFSDEFETGGGSEEIALRIHKELTGWLVNHIQKIDAQLGRCAKNGSARK